MYCRILIFYHTASGNTGWVTSQIAGELSNQCNEVTLRNIAYQNTTNDIEQFDLIGFGCPVMGFRPTFAMTDFINTLPVCRGKPCFIYLTCAGIRASSLWMLSQLLSKKRYMVAAAESFRSEVSWPVARLPGVIPDKGH